MGEQKATDNHQASIWGKSSPGDSRSVWFYLAIVLFLIALGFVVGGFGSISFSVDSVENRIRFGSGVNYFWPGIAVQQVGGIWFGAWGVIAGVIFPFFSNAVTQTPFLISLAYLPANFLQSFLPAFLFRRLNLDPRLQSGLDYLGLLAAMFFANLLGALWAVFTLLVLLKRISWGDAPGYFFGWFGGNMLAGVVFNFVVLKTLSQGMIEAKALVRKWWS